MAEKIVAIIGARLNSSRLPRKQLLPLAGKPLIARLVDRLRGVDDLDEIVLATTGDDYNQDLVTWADNYGVTVEAYRGDVNDLVGRVGMVARKYEAGLILYICGDCPLIEPKTLQRAIVALKADPLNETVEFAQRPDGKIYIHEGFDLYRRSFWDAMEQAATEPFEREHIGAVFRYAEKVIPRNVATFIDEDMFAGCEHRISVDTSSDYFFMRRIYEDWYANNPENTIVDLAFVLVRLKQNPYLMTMNAAVRQRKVGETCPEIAILCEVGKGIGLGHLSRVVVAARALQDHLSASLKIFIKGDKIDNEALSLLPHYWVSCFSEVPQHVWNAVVIDVKDLDDIVESWLRNLSAETAKIAIDQPFEKESVFDFMWQPSMYVAPNIEKAYAHKLDYGWHTFLLNVPAIHSVIDENKITKRVVVLTGGSDAAGLGQFLPMKLLNILPDNVELDWVQGPFSDAPMVSVSALGERFNILRDPDNLPALLAEYDAAFVVFGVSYFECLLAGIPTIVCDAANAATVDEWAALQTEFPDLVAGDIEEALHMLMDAIENVRPVDEISAVQEQLRSGPCNFASLVQSLLSTEKRKLADAS